MEKFYAVRKGKKQGIYRSWEDCKKAIDGFSGAEFKSFKTEAEAKAYINEEDIYLERIKDDVKKGYAVAYTDGSCDRETELVAYGVVIFDENMNKIKLCDSFEAFEEGDNIIGEVYAVIKALEWAKATGHKKLKIYHDYLGVAAWATGEHRARSTIAKLYVEKLLEYKDVVDYTFVKVKGHSNDKYNDEADRLATAALREGARLVYTPEIKVNCKDCIHFNVCEKARHAENYAIPLCKDYLASERKGEGGY